MKNEVDIQIGKNVRMLRNKLGMTQKDLGVMVGVTYQQIQKYEAAHSKVSACRIYFISKALKVPVSYFFKGIKLRK